MEIRRSNERGHADHGWLKTYHSFSFASYDDPAWRRFGPLRVINEDWIAPSQGFGRHGHRDMEILTYVIEGALSHRDSMGNGAIIQAGELQYMSAGTGVEHSEFNHDAQIPVHLLQIWIEPNVIGAVPRYAQQPRALADDAQGWQLLAGPEGAGAGLEIRQDAYLYGCRLDASAVVDLPRRSMRNGYVHVVTGSISIDKISLEAGDAALFRGSSAMDDAASSMPIVAGHEGATLLRFDLPSTPES